VRAGQKVILASLESRSMIASMLPRRLLPVLTAALVEGLPSIYLDLEPTADRAKLSEPGFNLS
jgi:hypothetical protein